MSGRAHIFFSGIVQGVGFRYTTHKIASELKLTGWVRNLSDGRVEIVAEGAGKTIALLVASLENHFSGSITGRDILEEPATGQFKDFRVI